MRLERLTIQLKPVGNNCNLECAYCYAMPFRKKKLKVLDKEVLEKIVKEAFEITDNLIVSWHGGEPTLVGLKFYKDYIEIVNKHKEENQCIVNMIQTNATLIDEEFAKFFKENNFIVSVSIDGKKETHNKNRFYAKGIGSYDLVMQGVNNLRKYGIYPPLIATVSKSTYDDCEESFKSFIDNGFKEIKFSPVYDSTDDLFSISCDEWYLYIKKIFDMWCELGDETINVRELDEVLEWFTGNTINTCSSTNTCVNWISINEDGEVYPCEYLRATESYGNIKDMHISKVFETEAYKRFVSKVMYVPEKCKKCEFYKMCGNGCPATRVKNGNLVYDGYYVYCEQRKKLYADLLEMLE